MAEGAQPLLGRSLLKPPRKGQRNAAERQAVTLTARKDQWKAGKDQWKEGKDSKILRNQAMPASFLWLMLKYDRNDAEMQGLSGKWRRRRPR